MAAKPFECRLIRKKNLETHEYTKAIIPEQFIIFNFNTYNKPFLNICLSDHPFFKNVVIYNVVI